MADLILNIKIEKLEEGGYLALSEDLPGLLAEGRSYQGTLEIAHDVAKKLIESYIEHNDPLPEKIKKQLKQPQKSHKFKIPISVEL